MAVHNRVKVKFVLISSELRCFERKN